MDVVLSGFTKSIYLLATVLFATGTRILLLILSAAWK
jgi:hypothetical protein